MLAVRVRFIFMLAMLLVVTFLLANFNAHAHNFQPPAKDEQSKAAQNNPAAINNIENAKADDTALKSGEKKTDAATPEQKTESEQAEKLSPELQSKVQKLVRTLEADELKRRQSRVRFNRTWPRYHVWSAVCRSGDESGRAPIARSRATSWN